MIYLCAGIRSRLSALGSRVRWSDRVPVARTLAPLLAALAPLLRPPSFAGYPVVGEAALWVPCRSAEPGRDRAPARTSAEGRWLPSRPSATGQTSDTCDLRTSP